MQGPRTGSAGTVRRPLGPGSVSAALGGFFALLSLPLPWATGCARVARACEGVNGFRGLGWRAAVPAACGLATVAVAARLARTSRRRLAPRGVRGALVLTGAITLVYCQYIYNRHPWNPDGPGDTAGGWGYGPGLLVLVLAGFLMFWGWACASPTRPTKPPPHA